jgi:hypothetical protein
LGEAFAHDSFAESAKFTLPSIFHDNLRWIYRSRAEPLTQLHGEFTAAATDSQKILLRIRGIFLKIPRAL